MKRRMFREGEVIFKEGERSDVAYLIMKRKVKILREGKDGKIENVNTMLEGQYFGEMGAIDDNPRSATAIAMGPVDSTYMDQDEFMDTLLNRPEESIHLLKVLFGRLRGTERKLARFKLKKEEEEDNSSSS